MPRAIQIRQTGGTEVLNWTVVDVGQPATAIFTSQSGSWSKLFRIAAALLALSPVTAVYAQHASDDPLATANDAFGLTLGLESIGLYGPGLVRGFNPR